MALELLEYDGTEWAEGGLIAVFLTYDDAVTERAFRVRAVVDVAYDELARVEVVSWRDTQLDDHLLSYPADRSVALFCAALTRTEQLADVLAHAHAFYREALDDMRASARQDREAALRA